MTDSDISPSQSSIKTPDVEREALIEELAREIWDKMYPGATFDGYLAGLPGHDGWPPQAIRAAKSTLAVLKPQLDAMEGIRDALAILKSGLGLVNHKFERAGGVWKVAHDGVELGANSWASNVENGLHNIGVGIECLEEALSVCEVAQSERKER